MEKRGLLPVGNVLKKGENKSFYVLNLLKVI